MGTLGKTLTIRGELRATEDLTIEGKVIGPIHCERSAIIIAGSADVTGNIIARDITVFGRTSGQLTATDIVDVRADASVTGHVVSRRFILDPAAHFEGRVEPQHLEAALRVARFQQRSSDAG
jgi:cytoskeletal protein CcmA (bactofilin family)